MRACTLLAGVTIGLAPAAETRILHAEPGKETRTERVAGLIRQLGHEEFAKREAASKELEAIGESSLKALRKAAASNDDLEIRRRAERIIQAIADRVASREWKKLEGSWTGAAQAGNGKEKAIALRACFTKSREGNTLVCLTRGEGQFLIPIASPSIACALDIKDEERSIVLDAEPSKQLGIDRPLLYKLDGECLQLIIREGTFRGDYKLKKSAEKK